MANDTDKEKAVHDGRKSKVERRDRQEAKEEKLLDDRKDKDREDYWSGSGYGAQ